jgi:hypothetical protein
MSLNEKQRCALMRSLDARLQVIRHYRRVDSKAIVNYNRDLVLSEFDGYIPPTPARVVELRDLAVKRVRASDAEENLLLEAASVAGILDDKAVAS